MWKLFLFFSDIWTFYMRKFEFWTRKVYIRLRKSVKDVVKEGDAVTFFWMRPVILFVYVIWFTVFIVDLKNGLHASYFIWVRNLFRNHFRQIFDLIPISMYIYFENRKTTFGFLNFHILYNINDINRLS